jgi:CheY-like chemotaxis protein
MRHRIIVLEDDPNTRRLLTLILEGLGYEVVSAPEPSLCPLYSELDALCTHPFACGDFLITDNHMPRMTGLQFVARQGARGCKGVVHNKAIVSGTWEAHELEAAEKLGSKVFTKPYRIQEILHWLEERKKTIPPDRKLADLGEL